MHFGKSSNHLCLAIHKFNQVRREHCPGNWTGNVPSGLLIDIKMLYLAQPGSQNSQNRKCRQFSGQILKTLIQWITWSVHLSRLSLWKSLTCYSNHLTVSAPQSITKPQKMSRKKSEKTRECPWGKHPTCCGSGRCGRCSRCGRCGRCGQSCNEIGFYFHQICNGWTWLNLVEPPSIMHRQSHFGRVFPEPGVPALLHSRALGSNQNRPGRTRRHLEQPRTGCQLRRFGSVMPCPNFIPCSKSSKKCSNKLPVWTPGRNADFFGTHGTQMELKANCKLNRNRNIESKIIKNQDFESPNISTCFFRVSTSLCRFVSSCALYLCWICAAHGATCDWRPKRPDMTTTSTASKGNKNKIKIKISSKISKNFFRTWKKIWKCLEMS